MKKVESIDYDKKDCTPIVCPCQSMTFTVFTVSQKTDSHVQHNHIRCLYCEQTFCLEVEHAALAQKEGL